MAKFTRGQIVVHDSEPGVYLIESVIKFPDAGAFYSIKKLNSNEAPEITIEEHLTLAKNYIKKEDKTMSTDINKTCDYTATPEELELGKAIKEATEEAEKKIRDIRTELAKKLKALSKEYQEKEAIKREKWQAHIWKRRYDALLKEGFSVEQAWEMTMKSFEVD